MYQPQFSGLGDARYDGLRFMSREPERVELRSSPEFGQAVELGPPDERTNPMTGKRKRYSVELKAKVALDAIYGEQTIEPEKFKLNPLHVGLAHDQRARLLGYRSNLT